MVIPLSATLDDFFSLVRDAVSKSSDSRVNFPWLEPIETPARMFAPTAETSGAMSVRMRRIDNVAMEKVAVLFCNNNYNGVVDVRGLPVGEVFEARHKTSLMERFLQETLGFAIVKTHPDVDLRGMERALDEV